MILGKTKWVYLKFMPYEFKGVEEYLEDMALKGWKLERIVDTFLKFKKIEPTKLKYTVDVIDEISFIDGENSQISMEYRNYCNMAGWEFICEKGKFQIYSKEFTEESVPIHTDEKERFEIIKKASKKYELIVAALNLFLIFLIYRVFNPNILASNTLLLTILIIGIKIMSDIPHLIYYIKWKKKAENSLQNGDKVIYPGKKRLIITTIRQKFIYLLFIILIIINYGILSIYDVIEVLVYITIGYTIRYFFNKSDGNNIKRRSLYSEILVYTIMGSIIIGTILIMVISVSISNSSSNSYQYASNKELSNKIETISIEDLGYEIKNEENTYINEGSSLFAEYVSYSIESTGGFMSYDLFRSKYKWAIDYRLKYSFKIINELNREYNFEEDIAYKEVETEYSKDGITIYSNNHGNSLIIVSDNIYLEIGCWDEDMINSDILKIVLDKIFNVKSY